MTDNVSTTLGTFATDDVSGVQYQIIKIAFGALDTATLVSTANGIPIAIAAPTTFYHGQKTVTTPGTELVLASSQALVSGVTVKALPTNTGLIYVGKNPVTLTTGFILEAGEQIFVETDNLADVFVDCSVGGEGVCFIGS